MSRLEVGACTHTGHVRRFNEDAHLTAPTLVAVADGMGGHSGGGVASRIVVDQLSRLGVGGAVSVAAGRAVLASALGRAHVRIREYAERQPHYEHAGTTAVVALLVVEAGTPRWLVGNVGDSRAYVLRAGDLVRVTRDHTVAGELLAAGVIGPDEAVDHPERHVLLRAVSAADAGEPDFFEVDGVRGTRLLLCSDGVCGLLPDEVVAGLLAVGAPQAAADALVAAALEAGGTDNATAVVVDVV